MASNVPAKIGKYDVIDVIGRGGMGIVYKATDPHLDRLVAIKMMIGPFGDNPDFLKRFYREAQSLGGLQHPNIVTVYDLGDYGGNPYLVMQYLEGEPLDSVLRNRRPLSLLEKINITILVCQGLSYAHHRGVVHRDIKPANIMLARDGSVKIFDFGIAHVGDQNVTRTGEIIGTLSYMSPEQVNAKPVDARTDIFSAGVVLYQIYTNHLPFEGESIHATRLKIVHDPPPPLRNFFSTYPAELENILLRALAKDPDERYSSADEFALDLTQLQAQLKQELIRQEMQAAALLLERGDIYKAQDSLLRVLKIDQHHTNATRLIREVQQRIKKEEIVGQVRGLRQRAEEALADHQFETAQECVERAISLDRNNVDLHKLSEEIRTGASRAKKLHDALKRAESAHAEGELDTAKGAAEEALELAPDDTEAKSLYRLIHRDWVERSRQRQMEGFLFQARQEISSRNFSAALDILKKAEALEPEAPQVRALVESAVSGREQERRRRELETITREVEDALNHDDYCRACEKADHGLVRFPGEPRLLKLRSLADRQRQIEERKQFVDEQIAVARNLLQEGRNEELLILLEAALAKVGAEPRLQSLLTIVSENVQRERLERRKAESLQKARNFLRNQEYGDAIRTLEAIVKEVADDVETRDLLERARGEQEASVQKTIRRAQEQSVLDLRIQILEEALRKSPQEAKLQEQLRGVHDLEKLVSSLANEARRLEQAQQYDHALVKWEALRSTYRHYRDLERIIENVRRLREQARTDARKTWIEKSQNALRSADYVRASALVGQAIQEFPRDADLMEIKERAEAGLRLRGKAQEKLADARTFLASQQWERGAETMVRACQIASHDPIIREQAASELLQASKAALEKNWRAAEVMLQRLPEIQPDCITPSDLVSGIAARKHKELVGSSYAAAKRMQSAGDFHGALTEVVHALSTYPDDPSLRELQTVLQERIRHAQETELLERARLRKEAFVQATISRAQQEPALDLRIQILEEALKREPQETRLQQQLRSVQDLSKLVSSIANDARSFEDAHNYDQALRKWEALRAVYRDYPDLDHIVEQVKRRQVQGRTDARANWIKMIQTGLIAGDYERAAEVLRQAKRDFPSDRELADLEDRVRKAADHRVKAQKILGAAEKAVNRAKWKKAAESFELAFETAKPDPLIRDQVLRGLLQAADAALQSDCQSAEMLVDQAIRVQPESPLLGPVKTRIENRKREHLTEQCLNDALRCQRAGDSQGALRALDRGLSALPSELRLLECRQQLENQMRKREDEQRPPREQEQRRSETGRSQSEGLATRIFVHGNNASPSNIEVPRDSLEPAPPRGERPAAGMPSGSVEPANIEPTQRWDTLQDFTLQTIERQLATFIGPLAKILVKRAASKATNSDELYALLAESLERDADRLAFLSGKAKLTPDKAKGQPRIESPQLSAEGAPLTSSSPLELTPAAIDQAARVLAPYVGPISAVLVRKAAKRADSLRSLYLLLAEHVEAGARRVRFLRDAGFPDA